MPSPRLRPGWVIRHGLGHPLAEHVLDRLRIPERLLFRIERRLNRVFPSQRPGFPSRCHHWCYRLSESRTRTRGQGGSTGVGAGPGQRSQEDRPASERTRTRGYGWGNGRRCRVLAAHAIAVAEAVPIANAIRIAIPVAVPGIVGGRRIAGITGAVLAACCAEYAAAACWQGEMRGRARGRPQRPQPRQRRRIARFASDSGSRPEQPAGPPREKRARPEPARAKPAAAVRPVVAASAADFLRLLKGGVSRIHTIRHSVPSRSASRAGIAIRFKWKRQAMCSNFMQLTISGSN